MTTETMVQIPLSLAKELRDDQLYFAENEKDARCKDIYRSQAVAVEKAIQHAVNPIIRPDNG